MVGADDASMGRSTVSTAMRLPRNVRMARRLTTAQKGVVAIVIECVDKSCTVVGSDFALDCPSLQDAKRVVEDKAAQSVRWRVTAPGFWVARAG
jgi:hypothetical protein